ncbi:MAG: NAD(P)/FAD-dependent oxidoreductase [Spirochaetota bacterium]
MADKFDLVIVGGGIAAVSAAEAFRERDEGGSVLILSEEDRAPYRRTKLSKRLVDGFRPDELAVYPAEWYEERRIELETNRKIVAVHPDAHDVEDAHGTRYGYGKLLLATGGAPVFPATISARESDSFFVLHSARDAERIMKAARNAKKVLVAGMGVLSVEIAWELHRLGKKITLVGATAQLMPRQLNLRAAEMLESLLTDAGVRLHFQEEILSFERRKKGGYTISMIRNSGNFDLIILAVGLRPRKELAEEAGLATATGIRVDPQLRTSDPDIYAAGDVAEHKGGHMTWLWHAAEYQGRIAGGNAAGGDEEYDLRPFRFRTEVFDSYFFSVNKPRAFDMAEMEEFEFENGSKYRAFYFSDDVLSGIVMANDPDNAELYERAAQERWSLARSEAELF